MENFGQLFCLSSKGVAFTTFLYILLCIQRFSCLAYGDHAKSCDRFLFQSVIFAYVADVDTTNKVL